MSQEDFKKCDVLILSADFGTGHHQVSVALKGVFKERRPHWEVGIYNYFQYIGPLFNKSLKFCYSQMIRHFSWGYDWFYRITRETDSRSKWQQMLNSMGRKRIYELILEHSPKVIICTFPTPAGVVSQLKREGKIDIPLAVVITDVTAHGQWIHPMADAYIVAADVVSQLLIEKGIPAKNIHVTGIPIRSQFEAPVPDPGIWIRHNLDQSLFTLLIMGGGAGLMPGIERICERLGDMGLPMQIVALAGSNRALAKNLEEVARRSPVPVRVLGYTENIAPVMRGSHLLLSKAGGITVFEALAVKLPILLYKPLPGHEMGNVNFLLDNGAALIAQNENQVVELIKNAVEDPSVLENISHAMAHLSKPSSARHAVSAIVGLVSHDHYIEPGDEISLEKKDRYA
ncbi:MAG TPA: glycosyltransferase [Clostridia bacterium]|nr:glycosyltransferase [Clostridia bacterium]